MRSRSDGMGRSASKPLLVPQKVEDLPFSAAAMKKSQSLKSIPSEARWGAGRATRVPSVPVGLGPALSQETPLGRLYAQSLPKTMDAMMQPVRSRTKVGKGGGKKKGGGGGDSSPTLLPPLAPATSASAAAFSAEIERAEMNTPGGSVTVSVM